MRAVRVGALLGSIAWASELADGILLTFILMSFVHTSPTTPTWLEDLVGPLTGLIGATILVLIIIALLNFYKGASHFRRFDPSLDVGRIGVLLIIGGVLVSLLGSWIAIMATSAADGSGQESVPPALTLSMKGVAIAGSGLMIVGSLLFAIMMLRLSREGLGRGFGIGGLLYLAREVLRTLTTLGLMVILSADVISFLGGILGFTSMLLIYRTAGISLRGFIPREPP
ncbi:MAG: hypothetical protein QI197_07990 [Candidatus Korarchaeota archaeon]|nr:hypothetical protein [Candidatus Korarchaeota archaeon]